MTRRFASDQLANPLERTPVRERNPQFDEIGISERDSETAVAYFYMAPGSRHPEFYSVKPALRLRQTNQMLRVKISKVRLGLHRHGDRKSRYLQ